MVGLIGLYLPPGCAPGEKIGKISQSMARDATARK
jgi:hypothetical protein